jgi:N-carbamoylputrescine amidase
MGMSVIRNGILAVAHDFTRDVDSVLTEVERAVVRARTVGAGLIVFPEAALGGYIREPVEGEMAPDLPPALDPDGPEIQRLVQVAGQMVICIGYTEAGEHGPYSSAVCVSGDGVLGRHRKVHLPPAERFAYTAGDGFAAFDTPFGRLGMLLCYDKLFPAAAASLALDGADTIACMSAWSADRHRPAEYLAADRQIRHHDVLDQARAIENQVVWVSANGTGQWGPLRFFGGSKIVDPDGVVLATTGTQPGMAFADIDARAAVESVVADVDLLADRRPHAYGPALAGVRTDAALSG